MTAETRLVATSSSVTTGGRRKPVASAPSQSGDSDSAERRAGMDMGRVRGAFDAGRCVATYRSFAQQLTTVGGARLAASAVSNVTVSPTHRRRGLLSRMIDADLAEAKERGDSVSTLIAAEYPIYGRYGYGPATTTAQWSVDVPRTGLDPRAAGPDDGGRIDLADGTDVRELGPELHRRLAATQHGVVDRGERWWHVNTGRTQHPWHLWTAPFYAVYRSPDGVVEGLLTYSADDKWGDGKQPLDTATVRDLIAVSPAAERALWRFVCSVATRGRNRRSRSALVGVRRRRPAPRSVAGMT